LSPRAAARRESLGFELVFDYVAGKQDWLANDLPFEGKLTAAATIGSIAERNLSTCRIGDKLQDVQRRLKAENRDFSVVVDDSEVVLGLLRKDDRENGAATVESVMQSGPSTYRPHVTVEELAGALGEKTLDPILVTTSDGRLIGAVRRKDLGRKKH
jgi:predicted transcriptional regulator